MARWNFSGFVSLQSWPQERQATSLCHILSIIWSMLENGAEVLLPIVNLSTLEHEQSLCVTARTSPANYPESVVQGRRYSG